MIRIKKIFQILFFCILLSGASVGQTDAISKSHRNYIEWNVGVALLDDFVFPGSSFLWGGTYVQENGMVLDYQMGLALPSIATAKLGLGYKYRASSLLGGVRLFPFNYYLQTNFDINPKGSLIFSIEYSPLTDDSGWSFYSKGNINMGYRWNIGVD